MKTIPIGELATRANVNVDTIRYCERGGGVIADPPRNKSGHRQHSAEIEICSAGCPVC